MIFLSLCQQYLVPTLGIEPSSTALQAAAMTTFAKLAIKIFERSLVVLILLDFVLI